MWLLLKLYNIRKLTNQHLNYMNQITETRIDNTLQKKTQI